VRFKLNKMTLNSLRRYSIRSSLAAALAFIFLFGGTLALSGGSPGAQKQTRRAPAAHSSPETPPPAAVPFRVGEQLSFRVQWSKYSVSAGKVDLSVVERRDFYGRLAWHFRAMAHSLNTVRLLYALDDQFDSYTDASNLTSLQYEMYLHEQGKQQDGAWRMTTADGPAPANATAARVLPGTRDPVGLLYALRAADWKSVPELHVPVFDGHNLYDVVARLAPSSGQVTVPAGQLAASCIDVRVFEHGQELDGTHFSLWLGQDPARTPLLIEAEIPFGSARVELMSLP
jgi:hypothetical protein